MNKYLRKGLSFGLSALMMVGVGAFASENNKVSASGYLTDSISRARRSRDYATRPMNLERLSNSSYFAGIRNTGKARINRGEKIGVAPFYHMGHDGFIVNIPGKRGIYYAPTNNHNWFGKSYRIAKHRVRAKRPVHKQRRAARVKRTKRVKRYNHKVRSNRHNRIVRNKRVAKKQIVYKARFKRSDNKRALKRSGFFNAHVVGGNFIFDKYAPNDKRAIVPKHMDVNNWYQGKFGQLNPTAYYYVSSLHGWLRLK